MDHAKVRRSWVLVAPWLVVLFLLGYGFLFFRCPLLLTSTPEGQTVSWSRATAFLVQLTLIDQVYLTWIAHGSMPTAIADRALPMLAVGTSLILAWRIGSCFLTMAPQSQKLSRWEFHGLAIVIGLQALSSLTAILGMMVGVESRWIWILGTLILWIACEGWCRRFPTWTPRPVESIHDLSPSHRRFALLIAVGLVLLSAVYLLGGILPAHDFDVLEYHLQAPKEFYARGKIDMIEHNVYANMPMGAEMHALAWTWLIDTPEGWKSGCLIGKTICSLYGVLGAWVIGCWVWRRHGLIAGEMAALAYVGCPGIAEVSTNGLIDAVLACSMVASVLWLIEGVFEAKEDSLQRWNGNGWIAGWLIGGAAATKYTAIPMLVVPIVLYLVGKAWQHRHHAMPSARQWTLACVVGLLVSGGPWYVKNAVLCRNPVYPLMGNILGGKTLDDAKIAQWNRAHQVPRTSDGSRANYGPQAFVGSLLEVSVTSRYLGLTLIPLACLGWIRWSTSPTSKEERWVGWMTLWILAVWWIFTHRLDRFWIPAIPMMAVAAGHGAAWLIHRWHGVIVYCFGGLAMLFSLLLLPTWPFSDNRFLVELDALRYDQFRTQASTSENDHPTPRVPAYQHWLNQRLGKSDRAVIVGHAAVFDLEIPFFYSTCFDRSPLEQWTRDVPPSQQWERMHQNGVTHVVIHWAEIERYRSPGNYGFSDYFTRERMQQFVDDGVLERVSWPIESEIADCFTLSQSR